MRNTQLRHRTPCKAQTGRYPAIDLVTGTITAAALLFLTSAAYADNRIAIGKIHSMGAAVNHSKPCSVEAFCNKEEIQQVGRFSLTRQLGRRGNTYLIFHGTQLRIKLVF